MTSFLNKLPLSTRIILSICLMTTLAQAGLVLYTPALSLMGSVFYVSATWIKFTLTAYLLGFGVSQLFYGPLSDQYGRKKVLLYALFIFAAGCLWSIFSNHFNELLMSRIMQGVGAGGCMTLSRAILRDSFEGKDYLHAASFLSVGFAIGLGVSPIVGGYLISIFSYKSEFVFLFVFSAILFLLFYLFLPETIRASQKNNSLSVFIKNTIINFIFILKNKNFLSYLIAGVMAYGVVIVYTIMSPFLIQKTLGYSAAEYGYFTLMIALAYYASTHVNRKLIHHFTTTQIIKIGLFIIILSGFIMLLLNLFHLVNMPILIAFLMLATFGQGFIWSNTIALALKELSSMAGTAAALFSSLQMLLSAIISAVLAIPSDRSEFPLVMAIFMLGLMSWFIFQCIIFRDR